MKAMFPRIILCLSVLVLLSGYCCCSARDVVLALNLLNPERTRDDLLKEYMINLRKRIQRSWSPSSLKKALHVKVVFEVSNNGELAFLSVDESSGDPNFDSSAKNAISLASPFAPPPQESLKIAASFDNRYFKSVGVLQPSLVPSGQFGPKQSSPLTLQKGAPFSSQQSASQICPQQGNPYFQQQSGIPFSPPQGTPYFPQQSGIPFSPQNPFLPQQSGIPLSLQNPYFLQQSSLPFSPQNPYFLQQSSLPFSPQNPYFPQQSGIPFNPQQGAPYFPQQSGIPLNPPQGAPFSPQQSIARNFPSSPSRSSPPLSRYLTPFIGHSYVGVGSGHWISKNSNGKIIELEDGSLWEISDYDVIDTGLWLGVTDITVSESDNPLYPYVLINTDDGEKAEAKLLKQ